MFPNLQLTLTINYLRAVSELRRCIGILLSTQLQALTSYKLPTTFPLAVKSYPSSIAFSPFDAQQQQPSTEQPTQPNTWPATCALLP